MTIGRKNGWLFVVVGFLLTFIAIGGIGKILLNNISTRTVTSLNYEVGALSNTTGKEVTSNYSLIMKNAKNVDGLEIKVKDNAEITYKVAFYDEDGAFIEMTGALDEDFEDENISVPGTAESFKIMIIPNQIDGEDVKVTALNILTYANMLEVTYNK